MISIVSGSPLVWLDNSSVFEPPTDSQPGICSHCWMRWKAMAYPQTHTSRLCLPQCDKKDPAHAAGVAGLIGIKNHSLHSIIKSSSKVSKGQLSAKPVGVPQGHGPVMGVNLDRSQNHRCIPQTRVCRGRFLNDSTQLLGRPTQLTVLLTSQSH